MGLDFGGVPGRSLEQMSICRSNARLRLAATARQSSLLASLQAKAGGGGGRPDEYSQLTEIKDNSFQPRSGL